MKKMIYSLIILIPIIGTILKCLTKDYAVGCSPFMDDNTLTSPSFKINKPKS